VVRRRRQQQRATPPPSPIQQEREQEEEDPPIQQRRNNNIYCGNNRRHPNSRNLGTRYECLQKGIGTGCYVIPIDLTLNDYDYESIDGVRIYCGGNANLPPNYTRFGNSAECFQIGRGIGMKKRAGGRCRRGG
jgi:hypothetical protein